MLMICLFFTKPEPEYAYKRYAYKKKTCIAHCVLFNGRKHDNRNLLELPKVELWVINRSLKTCNIIFELAPVSSEKLKYVFFPMRSMKAFIPSNILCFRIKELYF